jgi:hypothetical protein
MELLLLAVTQQRTASEPLIRLRRNTRLNIVFIFVLVASEKSRIESYGKNKKGNNQRVSKRRRLSLLTNCVLVYESQCGGMGEGGGLAGLSSQ